MTENHSFGKGVRLAFLVIFLVLFLDQASKIWIKTHMTLDEEIHVIGNWFILHFTENPGMAFGLEFGGEYGKLMLTLFRILAVSGLTYYLFQQIRQKAHTGFIICLAMITAGAAGNILDSLFYGLIFTESTHIQIAEMFPDQGYASFLHGEVVDMIYLPVFRGNLPEWLGGNYFIFFRPIFNLADASISLGVFFILIFQRRFFKQPLPDNSQEAVPSSEESPEQEGNETGNGTDNQIESNPSLG